MPDISNIPVPQYQPNQPYHWSYDNLPFESLVTRENIINSAVDSNTTAITAAAGSAGTIAARLNQALESNGDIKVTAIDNAMHNIGAHDDGTFTVSSGELTAFQADYPLVTNPVPFVRMLEAERQKLALIDDSATNTSIAFNIPSTALFFDSGTVTFEDSTTITWTSTGGQSVRADLVASLSNAHQHYDGIVPTSATLTPDYQTYLTGYPTAFTTGSLKVYINGVRIFATPTTVYYPTTNPLSSWAANNFTENAGLGFTLLNPITSNDIIVIDFEIPL